MNIYIGTSLCSLRISHYNTNRLTLWAVATMRPVNTYPWCLHTASDDNCTHNAVCGKDVMPTNRRNPAPGYQQVDNPQWPDRRNPATTNDNNNTTESRHQLTTTGASESMIWQVITATTVSHSTFCLTTDATLERETIKPLNAFQDKCFDTQIYTMSCVGDRMIYLRTDRLLDGCMRIIHVNLCT
jgi:hypothetical protein